MLTLLYKALMVFKVSMTITAYIKTGNNRSPLSDIGELA